MATLYFSFYYITLRRRNLRSLSYVLLIFHSFSERHLKMKILAKNDHPSKSFAMRKKLKDIFPSNIKEEEMDFPSVFVVFMQ